MLSIKARARTSTRMSHGDRVFQWVVGTILILMGAITLYPIYYVLIASVSDPMMVASGQVILFPRSISTEAYQKLWGDIRIWLGYRNSLFYTFVGTALDLCVTLPAGYALSRRNLFGRKLVMLYFVFTMYFSGGLIPTYIVIRQLGLINKIWALLLPNIVSVFNLVIVRSFFESTIPDALYEASLIDGCKHFRFFFQVVLPISPAIIAVMALYYGLAHWNAYFEPMIYISNEQLQTLQVIMKSVTATPDYTTSENITPEQLTELIRSKALIKYAIVVVASMPMLILYPFVQRFFIQGVMIGAVKG